MKEIGIKPRKYWPKKQSNRQPKILTENAKECKASSRFYEAKN